MFMFLFTERKYCFSSYESVMNSKTAGPMLFKFNTSMKHREKRESVKVLSYPPPPSVKTVKLRDLADKVSIY